MRFWMGPGASAGDPLIEFGIRGAAEHGYDVLFDNFSNEGDTKFTAAYGANDLPDMFETDYPYMGSFLDIGALDPMDNMLAAVNCPLDNVLPHILDRCRWDGKLYAVPLGWNSWVLFYNLDHLDAEGLPTDREPERPEEFVEWARVTTLRNSAGDIIQSGILCPRSGIFPNNIWGALLYQYGGSMVTDDGTAAIFNNEAGRKAAEFVLDCLYDWEITDPNITQLYDYRLQGLGTTFFSGTWAAGSSIKQNLNIQARRARGLPTTVAAVAGLNLVNIMIPFIESNDVLDDPPRLRKRLRDHGYLFIRGMLPRDEVSDLRRKFLEFCSEAGWLRPGSDLMDGLTDHRPIMEGEPEYAAVYAKIQSQESFHRMKFNEGVMSVMADIFEEPVVPLPQTIGRIAFPRDNARGTHPHQDWIFVRGSTETLSLWAPLGDVPLEVGGLKILASSHKCGFLEPRPSEGPGHRIVDTDPDLEWHQSAYQCGDVLIFKMLTVHGAAENHTPDKLRLSVDFRYAGTSHVICDEWLEPHGSGPDKGPFTWANLQREWQDSPIADYWESWVNVKTRPGPLFWEGQEG